MSPATLAGTARLPVVVAVALSAFLAQALLHYTLPLFFEAKGMARVSWETWSYYEIIAWLFGPPLAGLLAGRLGERVAWSLGMAGYALVGGLVFVLPSSGAAADSALGAAAFCYGVASALIWVGGISLAQNVPDRQKGLSNALIMTSLGAGSIAGPLIGRWLVGLSAAGQSPQSPHFYPSLAVYSLFSVMGAVLILGFGQHGGTSTSPRRDSRSSWRQSLALLKDGRYLTLIITLSLLGGPVFQATNVYRPYRARDPEIGLIVGAQDHGWAALEVTNYVMQLLGGILIGLLAGKKAALWMAALMLAAFSACGAAIGAAPSAIPLFAFSAVFELIRQFMRWVQTGYVSEYVSERQRPSAIGLSVTCSGLGSWAFNLLTRNLQSPNEPGFSSSLPFYIAACIGLTGALVLFVASRWRNGNRLEPPAAP
ncbi:MAG: MFS transporter [Bryobacteraceae bacterium]